MYPTVRLKCVSIFSDFVCVSVGVGGWVWVSAQNWTRLFACRLNVYHSIVFLWRKPESSLFSAYIGSPFLSLSCLSRRPECNSFSAYILLCLSFVFSLAQIWAYMLHFRHYVFLSIPTLICVCLILGHFVK